MKIPRADTKKLNIPSSVNLFFFSLFFRRARYKLSFGDKVKGQSSQLTPGGEKRVLFSLLILK